MTHEHVLNAKTQGSRKIVTVDDGKTFGTTGPAGLQFTPENFNLPSFYMKRIKPTSESNQIFCKEDGSFADTSAINQFLQKGLDHFGQVHNLPVPHITCSLIRKTWVTMTREDDLPREEQMIVAQHMDHIVTADRNYDTSTAARKNNS